MRAEVIQGESVVAAVTLQAGPDIWLLEQQESWKVSGSGDNITQ